MYLPSNTPLLQDQREAAARHGAESDARIENMRRTAACGRARLFNTLINPDSIADSMGLAAAIDAAKLQQQTEISRASGLLGGGGSDGGGPSIAEIIAGAPEVVSLNRGGGCQTRNEYRPVPMAPNPQPAIPQRAPVIVQGPAGPLYFQGAPPTIPYAAGNVMAAAIYRPPTSGGAAPSAAALPMKYMRILNTGGLTGYAPPWSDAGVLPNGGLPETSGVGVGGWISEHPWWALALAGVGVLALSQRGKR